MTGLTTEQLDRYNSKGYISPINALSSLEAKEVRDEIEKIEKDWPRVPFWLHLGGAMGAFFLAFYIVTVLDDLN